MIYYNHTYDTDQNAVIIEYLKEYWQTDFIEHIISGDDKVNPCAEDEQGNHYCGIYWPNEESYPDFNGADSRYFYALSDAKAKNAKEFCDEKPKNIHWRKTLLSVPHLLLRNPLYPHRHSDGFLFLPLHAQVQERGLRNHRPRTPTGCIQDRQRDQPPENNRTAVFHRRPACYRSQG